MRTVDISEKLVELNKKLSVPDFLEKENEETLLQSMLDAIPDDVDKSEGSYIWDSLMPVAIEIAKIIEFAKSILRYRSIIYSFGIYLDLIAIEYGIVRMPPTKSTGEVQLIGIENTVIPKGVRFSTESDNVTPSIEFEVTEQVIIDSSGQVDVPIRAIVSGVIGNVEANKITVVLPGVTGITAVTNQKPTSGGYDEESDDSLRQRILEDNQKDEGDGNIDDYKIWSKEVTGVGNVLVEPLWNGPNTVRVIVLNQEGDAATIELVQAVQDYLDPGQKGLGEGKAPIGSRVTVDTATVAMIKATIPDLVAESGYTIGQAKLNAESALREYLNTVNPGGEIIVKEAESVVINASGVRKFGDLLLNGSRNDIIISSTELADLGSVMYS